MLKITQSIVRVRSWRKQQKLSLSELARRAGMRESTIRDIDKNSWNPTAKTLNALEAVLPKDFMR